MRGLCAFRLWIADRQTAAALSVKLMLSLQSGTVHKNQRAVLIRYGLSKGASKKNAIFGVRKRMPFLGERLKKTALEWHRCRKNKRLLSAFFRKKTA